MTYNFEALQKFSKEQIEASTAAAGEFAKNLQAIAAEASDFSKKSIESGSAYFEKLSGVKKFEDAIALQTEYAKSSYETFVAQTTKFGELYTKLAKDAFKPLEGVFAKAQSTVQATVQAAAQAPAKPAGKSAVAQ